MATRTVTIQLLEQTPQIRTLRFFPDLSGVDGSVLLEEAYTVDTDNTGAASIDLPVKDTGSIRYAYEIPRTFGKSTGYFTLAAGDEITLDALIELGAEAGQSSIDYINDLLGGIDGGGFLTVFGTNGIDGGSF